MQQPNPKSNIRLKGFVGLIFLIIASLFVCSNFIPETRSEIKDTNHPFLNLFIFDDLTVQSFDSWSTFQEMFFAKLQYDTFFRMFLLVSTVSFFAISYVLLKKKKQKTGDKKLEAIFDKVGLVFIEPESRDKQGHLISAEIKHYPKIDFNSLKESSSFILDNVHPKVSRDVEKYAKGLLQLLKEEKYIEIDEGLVEETGFPNQFKFVLITDEVRARKRMESVFVKAGLFFEEQIGPKKNKIFPIIKILENGNLEVNVAKANITKDQLVNSLGTLSTEFSPKKYTFVSEKAQDIYEIHCLRPASLLIKSGETIVEKYNEWIEKGPVKKMKELWINEKQFYWSFGSVADASITLDSNDIIVSGDQLVHPYIAGTTGSGKTEALKTLLMTIKAAYGDQVEIYTANGASSADLDTLHKTYSPMGDESAKPEGIEDQDKLATFLSILHYADVERKRRAQAFKDAKEEFKKEVIKVADYRNVTNRDMSEIVIAVDEFAGYAQIIGYEANYTKSGSVAFILQVGFSQWRKFGIHFVLATQEMKAASIPRRLFTNMSGGVIFNISGSDKSYMEGTLQYNFEGRDPLRFGKGEGLFNYSTIACKTTGATKIPIYSPYIGKDILQLVDLVGFQQQTKVEYNRDILSLTDKDLEFTNLPPKTLQLVIEKCFLEREGWRVYRKENPNHRMTHTFAENQSSKQKISISFVDSNDVNAQSFKERIEKENEGEVDIRIFFIVGKGDVPRIGLIKSTLEELGVVLVFGAADYVKPLREAYDYLKEDNFTEVFNHMLGSLSVRNKERMERQIKELYTGKFKASDISIAALEKIIKNPSANEKGDAFEQFFLTLERAAGHNTIHGTELSLRKIVNLTFANPKAEGGLDAFRWTNETEKRGIGFQLKNQPSKAIDYSIVQKMYKTRALYEGEGMKFDGFYLISTGPVTSQCRMEAEALGFTVVDGMRLRRIIVNMDRIETPIEEMPAKREIKPYPGPRHSSNPEEGKDNKTTNQDAKKLLSDLIEDVKKKGGFQEEGSKIPLLDTPDESLEEQDEEDHSNPEEDIPRMGDDQEDETNVIQEPKVLDLDAFRKVREEGNIQEKRRIFASFVVQLMSERGLVALPSDKLVLKKGINPRDVNKGVALYREVNPENKTDIEVIHLKNRISKPCSIEVEEEMKDSCKLLTESGYNIVSRQIWLSGVATQDLEKLCKRKEIELLTEKEIRSILDKNENKAA